MSSCTILAIALSGAGAICEFAGLGLVAREIAHDRARGRRLLAKLGEPTRPARTYPTPTGASFLPPNYTNSMWSTSMQIQGVVRHVQQLESEVEHALVGLKKLTDNELDNAIQLIQRDLAERDTDLRDGLAYVLAGSARDRIVGVGLLFTGIVLGVAGSILGNVA
jgi:hypothetical protein